MDSLSQHLEVLQYMITPAKQMVVDISGMYDPLCTMQREPILIQGMTLLQVILLVPWTSNAGSHMSHLSL
jgi:hypothetical protein